MKKILLITKIFLLSIFTIIIIVSSFYVYAFITPKTNINSSDSITYYDKNGDNIFQNNNNEYVKLDNINKEIINAIISIEDKNYSKNNKSNNNKYYKW